MTRVLIIGSSHIGALKNAEGAFADAHPDITVDFFGMRGPAFLKGQMNAEGVFHPHAKNDADRDLILKANGMAEVATASYDRVVLIGHRFGFNEVAGMLEHHDVLGFDSAGHGQALEPGLLEDVIDTMIDVTFPALMAALAPAARPMIIALAPYPAQSITARAPQMEMARELAAFWAHPAADAVFEMWQTALRSRIAAAGHEWLEQPADTVAGPFATEPRFAKAPGNFDGSAMKASDHRHMNAEYGLAVLTALVHRLKTTGAPTSTAPTLIKERI
ncbi:hypothetical protein [Sulfitobacter sp. JB4-11]|uniref:hypothetical protein n=1 Tax=Sulfitobacter rhodophyticola TaxID=3238304 RepID=UPI0035119684